MSVSTSIFSDKSCVQVKRWFQPSGEGNLKCFVLRAYWELSVQIGHEFRSCSKVFPDPRVSSYLSATTKIVLCHDKRFFSNDDDNGENFPQKVCCQCPSQEFSLDLTNSFSGTLEKGLKLRSGKCVMIRWHSVTFFKNLVCIHDHLVSGSELTAWQEFH